MSDSRSYNGWTNYPTWAASLWIGEGFAGGTDDLMELAAELIRKDDNPAWTLSNEIKDRLNDELEADRLNGFADDLLGYAFQEINFYEIAEHYIADVNAEEKREEE